MLINRTAHNNGIYRRSFHFVRANILKKLHSISENANKHLCMIHHLFKCPLSGRILFKNYEYFKNVVGIDFNCSFNLTTTILSEESLHKN